MIANLELAVAAVAHGVADADGAVVGAIVQGDLEQRLPVDQRHMVPVAQAVLPRSALAPLFTLQQHSACPRVKSHIQHVCQS